MLDEIGQRFRYHARSERGEVDVVSLISRRMSLDDGAVLLQSSGDRNGVLKVLVRLG